MIGTLVLAVALVLCIILAITFDKHEWIGLSVLSTIGAVILAIAVFVCAYMAIDEACCYDEYYASKMTEYEALVYKVENLDSTYSDEFGMRKAELIDEVGKWNVEVTKNSALTDNIWCGILYPDWWKEIPLIDYSMIGE